MIRSILFGFRDDLDLDQRWWHRLAKVSFIVFALVATTVIVFLASDVTPDRGNITVLTTLPDFTEKNGKGGVNTTPAFLASPGELGLLSPESSYVGYVDS